MTQFALLKTRRFLPIFTTQFMGAFNDNIYKNALIIFIAFTVADHTGKNSSILVSVAAGLFILPFFLFSALAGQLADKYEKSLLIQRVKIAEIMIMFLAAAGFILLNVYVLMTVLFLLGIQAAMFGPLKYGILPQHLQESELTGGNGMIQMATFLAILLGTMIGGILIAIKPHGHMIVSGLVLVIAGLGWLASRYIPLATPADRELRINWNIFSEIINILRFSAQNRTVFWSIFAISWFWFYGATFMALTPSYTRDVLYGNEHVTTVLLVAFSVGIGAGSLLCERLSGPRIEMGLMLPGAAGLSLFALDLHFSGMPQWNSLDAGITAAGFLQDIRGWRILMDLGLLGVFGGLYIVPLYALVQNLSAVTHRARVIAANNILNSLFMVISAVMIIILLALEVTIPQIFLLIAVLNVAVTGLVLLQVPDFVRRFLVLFRIQSVGQTGSPSDARRPGSTTRNSN